MEAGEAPKAEPEKVPTPIVEEIKKQPEEYIQYKYQLDETLKRILSHRGIVGTIITDGQGIPIESTMDKPTTAKYASYMIPLAVKSRDLVREVHPKDRLRLLRVRTKVHEIVVVPNGGRYIMVVQLTSIKGAI